MSDPNTVHVLHHHICHCDSGSGQIQVGPEIGTPIRLDESQLDFTRMNQTSSQPVGNQEPLTGGWITGQISSRRTVARSNDILDGMHHGFGDS